MSTKEPTSEPQHFLYLTRGPNSTITVNLAKAKGNPAPLYSVTHNPKMHKMEIRRLRCDAASEQRPVGAVKLRTLPPRVEVTVRGAAFKMARRHPLSTSLAFRFLGAGEMRWERLPGKAHGMRLVDFNGSVRAHFRPRMHIRVLEDSSGGGGADERKRQQNAGGMGNKAGWGPGFELHAAKLADLDLDLIVTTGLAAAEYRRQLDEDWDDVAEESERGRSG
ncbi:hypothetical protein CPLU01_05396 [Colletotrichum plurivorum]|uniref:Uncharacterized protein n=1 Tax=Colletotrichum plurivorum TaxID=2175906 RepID=A0A8H6NIB3_9PEZI|nr:hypothetical protein CPLU01_05396 [Colletotrichum plurivorum]